MAYRRRKDSWANPGAQLKIRNLKRPRDLIRMHLRRECLTVRGALPEVWGVSVRGAESIMAPRRPLAVDYVRQFADAMKLSEEDRRELMLAGARESGWEV